MEKKQQQQNKQTNKNIEILRLEYVLFFTV
jgi:hypothetical protein